VIYDSHRYSYRKIKLRSMNTCFLFKKEGGGHLWNRYIGLHHNFLVLRAFNVITIITKTQDV
jgi:hypothetical protein